MVRRRAAVTEMALRADSRAGVVQNTRIFRYYRDLISFQERGMPNQLLRCVNPSEVWARNAYLHRGAHVAALHRCGHTLVCAAG
jgi:hypothetical protein|eukprot:COSAG01_NODE_287_length_19408_cov_231.791703_2_plen_84_part_00